MAAGAMARHRQSGRPQHLSVWCKFRLGWLRPTTLDPAATQKIILHPGECVRVLPHQEADSYFLLVNRQPVGFDASLPDPALLLWQIEKIAPRFFTERCHQSWLPNQNPLPSRWTRDLPSPISRDHQSCREKSRCYLFEADPTGLPNA